jgi:hypothetical protein
MSQLYPTNTFDHNATCDICHFAKQKKLSFPSSVSVMSHNLVYFNALFSLVLFRFDFILLQIYFFFESFTSNFILFYFRNEYMVEGVLEQKKEDWSKYSAKI